MRAIQGGVSRWVRGGQCRQHGEKRDRRQARAVVVGCLPDDDDPREVIGVPAHGQDHVRAERVPDGGGAVGSQPLQDTGHGLRLRCGVEGGRCAGAAVAEQVDADHPVLGREFGGHSVEPVHRAGEAVHEDHGRSVLGSVLAHVHVVAIDADEVPDPSSLGARRVRHGGYDNATGSSLR
jgi:hypothetical protein